MLGRLRTSAGLSIAAATSVGLLSRASRARVDAQPHKERSVLSIRELEEHREPSDSTLNATGTTVLVF